MMDIAAYRITYEPEAWTRIAKETGNYCCSPLGAVLAVNALCDEVERLRAELAAMTKERDEYGNALHDLLNAADDSDDAQYGTLSASFVRDVCKIALEVKRYVK